MRQYPENLNRLNNILTIFYIMLFHFHLRQSQSDFIDVSINDSIDKLLKNVNHKGQFEAI
jgi:hypothetical protein